MSVNEALLANNSRWTSATIARVVGPAGAPALVVIPISMGPSESARSVTVSNTGPVNLWISDAGGAQAILLQPGAALSIGLGVGAQPYVLDIVGTGTLGVVTYE